MNKTPPKWARKFFRWFCRHDLADAVEGDLLELYQRKAESLGRLYANWFYVTYVISFFQPFAFKRQHEQYSQLNPLHMFSNHLKVGFRFIKKHKGYSAINVFGLAMGISAFLLMALFVSDELSYDGFHEKSDDILRLTYRLETPNTTREGAKLPFPVKQVLLDDYPEVKNVARIYYWGGDTPLLEYGDHKYTEELVYFSESSLFEVFDFELLRGNPETALADPRSIVITESMVPRYFGSEDPMGKIMRYKNEDDLVVTGVMKDIPDNSHVKFDFLLPIELQRQRWLGWGEYTYDLEKDWNWAAAWVYAEVLPETDREAFEQKLQSIAGEHLNTEEQDGFSLEVQPLLDIHLRSDKSDEARANGNLTQLYSFAAIGLLILLIACTNFVNLTSAQMNKRIKEVGLRKVVGARRAQLIGQFVTESLLLVVFASALALIVAFVTLPYFNEFTNKSMSMGIENLPLFLGLIGLVLIIGLLSGLRPSLAAVRVKAIQGLANQFKMIRSGQRFTRTLVVGQFLICNLLLLGILVVNNQLSFLQNKNLGFDKEQVLVLRHARNLSKSQYETFENQVSAMPAVKNINRGYIAGTSAYTNTFKIVGSETEATYSLGIKWVGEGFVESFGLELLTGREFDENLGADIGSDVLINAAAAEALGWSPEESIRKKISFLPGAAKQPEEIRIIGVLADANFESLYDPVLPSVFRRPRSSVGSPVSIKLATTDLRNTMAEIENIWESVIPSWPFESSFLDQTLEEQYLKEERLASAIRYFTLLAVFIACLGLFGLASFAIQQRTKEIGIRKVMGASVRTILMLVSCKFLWLTGLAFLLSVPIGYYLYNLWLDDFAYRITISPVLFLLSGLLSFAIALLAVGGHSVRAATVNPVKTLRYE